MVRIPAGRVVPDPEIRASSAVACAPDAGAECCNFTTHLARLTCDGDDVTFSDASGTIVECQAVDRGQWRIRRGGGFWPRASRPTRPFARSPVPPSSVRSIGWVPLCWSEDECSSPARL